jgi:hypothetical protein
MLIQRSAAKKNVYTNVENELNFRRGGEINTCDLPLALLRPSGMPCLRNRGFVVRLVGTIKRGGLALEKMLAGIRTTVPITQRGTLNTFVASCATGAILPRISVTPRRPCGLSRTIWNGANEIDAELHR